MNKQRIFFLLAGLFLLVSIEVPYLAVIFTSPQYPDRSPVVYVYTNRLAGDLHEWQVVGRYIGVKVPPELPEFEHNIIPALLVALSAVTIGVGFSRVRWKKFLPFLFLFAGLLLAAWGQYRLHQAGHNLDPTAPMRYAVKPFTPPLVGVVTIHRITIYHIPYFGVLLFGVAAGLTFVASWSRQFREPTVSS